MQVERDGDVEWRPGEYKVRPFPPGPGLLRSEKIPVSRLIVPADLTDKIR